MIGILGLTTGGSFGSTLLRKKLKVANNKRATTAIATRSGVSIADALSDWNMAADIFSIVPVRGGDVKRIQNERDL